MKKIITIALSAIACMSLVSCLKDLDAFPLNPYDSTSETAYNDQSSYLKGLAYLNANYSFVSQNSAGDNDLHFSDSGQSELLRQWFNMNDLCTGSLDIGWPDSYIISINDHSWTNADNTAVTAVYTRCMNGIVLCNEYLLQTTDEKVSLRGHDAFKSDIHQYRAEARFHRCMYYYILLDLFGRPPKAMEANIGGELPTQFTRTELFEWLETELKELSEDSSDMPAKGKVAYPRPTKDAARALLARMYLNAEVYTGTARWEDAKTYAKKVIDNGYSLHPKYQELFMQDNGKTCSGDEFIFAVEYDAAKAQSWGGTTTLSCAAFDDTMNEAVAAYLGITEVNYVSAEKWNGYHIPISYVEENFELGGVNWDGTGLGYDPAKSDKRLFLYNAGAAAKDYASNLSSTGWRCWKWAYLYSDGTIFHRGGEETDDWKLSNADLAIFRLPEMYYIYAESDARLHGGSTSDATAVGYIKALRDRAGLSTPASLSVAFILKDKAAEYLWEGQRRQDEIRLGIFDSDPHRYVYPILETDIAANPDNITQNEGYK